MKILYLGLGSVPFILPILIAGAAAGPPRAGVIAEDFPGLDRRLAGILSAEVAAAGYAVEAMDGKALLESGPLAPRFDLLVIPGARGLPAAAGGAIEEFLRSGGRLIAAGLPGWEEPTAKVGGRWLARSGYEEALAARPPDRVLIDFAREDIGRWRRSANDGASRAARTVDRSEGAAALRVTIEALTGWDTLSSPDLDRPFLPGHSLTCFEARGAPATRQLAIEWVERDGSRWIATVPLGESWRRYALPPESFAPWEPPPGRGGKGDRLRVEDAVRISFGLAMTHTRIEGGRHEYRVRQVGTAANPFGDAAAPPAPAAAPSIEGLSPSWLFHPIHGPVEIATTPGLALAAPARLEPPPGSDRRGLHPRPQGAGFAKGRPWRWQPLLVARSPDGDHRGTLAALLVNLAPPRRGSAVASLAPAAPDCWDRPAARRLLRDVAAAMRRGVFFEEGGSDRYTVPAGKPVRLGARVANFGKEPAAVEVRIEVRPLPGPAEPAFVRAWPLRVEPGAAETVEDAFDAGRRAAGPYAVTVDLLAGGAPIDRLSHDLHIGPSPAAAGRIEIAGGRFALDGKPWKAHGVNYMPSSGIALTNGDLFENWLGAAAYDPEVIDRDLRRVRALGFNSVSVFVYRRALDAGNLLDFLGRCRTLGLRANQSLRPGTPMDFRWTDMRELIEGFGLAGDETVLAYDLAWEPSHLGHAYQRRYDEPWAAWIAARHGTVEAAERAWGVPAPREGGKIKVPPMEMLVRDGEWRRLAADYRRFLDDLVGERYAEARRLVRAVDPVHPVSFRMQHAGDPTLCWEALLPYDFPGLAGAVDIWEPEAYGRIGDWDRVKAGRFTADWARLCDPAKPLMWAEMGYDTWDPIRGAPDPGRQAFQARFYRDFYRMMIESGAAGVFFWWWPGGYRVGENSDFGIIEPDGTDRPVTRVIREEGPRFLAAPRPPAPDVWIEVDRDRDARGLFGVYEAVKDRYWAAVAAGKTPGLRWAK